MITFRPLDPETDLPAQAALINLTSPLPVTPDLLAEWRRRASPQRLRQQIAAVDEAGAVVGIGDAVRDPWMPAGQFWIDVVVEPARRGEGTGAELYTQSEAWAREHGAVVLGCDVRGDQPEGRRFAEAHGFKIAQHTHEYRQSLDTFDAAVFTPLFTRLEAEGFAFLSYAEAGDSRDHRKAIYRVHRHSVPDDPTFPGVHLPLATFSQRIFESSWARPDELWIAVRGAQWVAYAQLADFPASNSVLVTYTGVERAWRQRGLATALCAKALAHAAGRGVSAARLETDARAEAMQATARRLGFSADAGSYRMLKSLMGKDVVG